MQSRSNEVEKRPYEYIHEQKLTDWITPRKVVNAVKFFGF